MTSHRAGVSDSNLSKGHIATKKCSAGHSLLKKEFSRAAIYEKPLKINKIGSKFVILSVFEMLQIAGSVFETPDIEFTQLQI